MDPTSQKIRVISQISRTNLDQAKAIGDKQGRICVAVGNRVLEILDHWVVERQLWIGCLKNDPASCPLAKIPNEMICQIIFWIRNE